MRQQINLYQPIFTEPSKPLSASTVAILLGVVVIGLAAYSINSGMQVAKLSKQVDAQREIQTKMEAQLAEATAAITARSNPAAAEARVKQLTASLDERTRALELLKSGAAGQTTGFAARFAALARRHVDGLWIDRLTISGTNGSMSLAGATLNADIVPEYLRNLAQEPVMAGTRFDDFSIERAADVAVSAEPADAAKPATKERFIRFRAGNRALDRSKAQGAT